MQRSRQYDKHRAETAATKAVEYRVEKLAWKDEKAAVVVVSFEYQDFIYVLVIVLPSKWNDMTVSSNL